MPIRARTQVFWSFVLFCLSAARLGYTTHLPRDDPLNNGHDFYGACHLPTRGMHFTERMPR